MPINWNKRKYTEEQFILAWNSSKSIAQVAKKLNLNIYGSTYQTLKATAKELQLNYSHMTGQAHLKGKTHNYTPRQSLDSILVLGKKIHGSRLLKRLIEERGWERKCNNCNLENWLGQPIALELEHINGNSKDNRINNLCFLCPNCHSQTTTWRGRNKGRVME